MKNITTSYFHQGIAFALVALGGLLAIVIVMEAQINAAMIDEQATHLEERYTESGVAE